jgi:conjugal transfer pilus assembly protein TraB
MPLLLELTDKAVLPNRFRSDIQRCFVTANATGDLSSERVLIRLDRLSCLDETGGAVDVKLTGYVAGEDGKTGLRARVVTRSGQAIANALLVGTLSGLGDAVSLAAQESSTNFAGTVTTTVKNPWKSGLGEGMKDAMDRIADYYLRLADKIFPVLEIDAGRQVDIVVTQSASIEREMP